MAGFTMPLSTRVLGARTRANRKTASGDERWVRAQPGQCCILEMRCAVLAMGERKNFCPPSPSSMQRQKVHTRGGSPSLGSCWPSDPASRLEARSKQPVFRLANTEKIHNADTGLGPARWQERAREAEKHADAVTWQVQAGQKSGVVGPGY